MVGNKKKEAKPDFVLSEMLKPRIRGFLVVEDKTDSNFRSFAQLIAKGIAVAQQPDWKKDSPVYMVLCKGFALTFFKAQFSQTILENVKEGNDFPETFKVKRFLKTLNLSNGDELFMISKIFGVIKKEIKKEIMKEFNN